MPRSDNRRQVELCNLVPYVSLQSLKQRNYASLLCDTAPTLQTRPRPGWSQRLALAKFCLTSPAAMQKRPSPSLRQYPPRARTSAENIADRKHSLSQYNFMSTNQSSSFKQIRGNWIYSLERTLNKPWATRLSLPKS